MWPYFVDPYAVERFQLRLWWVGERRVPIDWSIRPTPRTPYTTVWYVLQGSLAFGDDLAITTLRTHDLALIPPEGRPRSWNAGNEELIFLSLGFEFMLDSVEILASKPLVVAEGPLPTDIEELWLEMGALSSRELRAPLDYLALSGMARLWWARICDFAAIELDAASHATHPALSEALAFMRSRFHEPITVADVAQHVHLSGGYLRNLFREHLGKSFRKVLLDMRLAQAKRLLLGSDMLLDDVARQVGYSDVHHFSRAFRREVGVPPSTYRSSSGWHGV